jgi:hypothetical protein
MGRSRLFVALRPCQAALLLEPSQRRHDARLCFGRDDAEPRTCLVDDAAQRIARALLGGVRALKEWRGQDDRKREAE